ncbi:divergent polysaccharide deacetylase family protein, partial [Salmonella enterica]|uniref:divergent polysaccharide deacetylase family protein n=1 Tax=Salmonella enterica TaxID=28901 RepID=UPI003D268F38
GEPPDAATIDRRLALLETRARERGVAVGIAGPPTPVLIERLAVWSRGLGARGLALAPLSALPAGVPEPSS